MISGPRQASSAGRPILRSCLPSRPTRRAVLASSRSPGPTARRPSRTSGAWPEPSGVLVYVMPPVFLAVTVDRVVAVIRRHVLGDAERSAWAAAGRALAALARGLAVVLLYGLRFLLAPPSTGAGLRRVVLNATPLPAVPERSAIPAAEEVPAIGPPPVTEPPELAGASKKVRLAWWYERDDAYGDRKRTAEAAKRLAPKVDLSEGTARAYIGAILDGTGRAA